MFEGMNQDTSEFVVENQQVTIGENVHDVYGGTNKATLRALIGGYVYDDENPDNVLHLRERGYRGNTLTIASRVETSMLDGFAHYNFVLPADFGSTPDDVMIDVLTDYGTSLVPDAGLTSIAITRLGGSLTDEVVLIRNDGDFVDVDLETGETTALAAGDYSALLGTDGITEKLSAVRERQGLTGTLEIRDRLDSNGQELVFIPDPTEPDAPDSVPDDVADLTSTDLAALTPLWTSDDLFADTLLRSPTTYRDGAFALARAGREVLDGRQDAETNTVTGIFGFGTRIGQTEAGAFVETGYADFDLDRSIFDGKFNFVGAGVFFNTALLEERWHVFGNLRAGRLDRTLQASGDILRDDADGASLYAGAMLGTSFDFALSERIDLRAYAVYHYETYESDDVRLAGAAGDGRLEFDRLDAHRVRAGFYASCDAGSAGRPYAGVAIERIVKAESSAAAVDAYGRLAAAPSDVEGTSAVFSLGWKVDRSEGFSWGFGLEGAAGERRNLSGTVDGTWRF